MNLVQSNFYQKGNIRVQSHSKRYAGPKIQYQPEYCRTAKQQKRECKFYKCLKEGKYEEVYTKTKALHKECPICFEEMEPPTKILQCSKGHLLCENCYKKVTEPTKTCPFYKRDVASNSVRNRALEELIENEAKTDVGAASQN